MAGAVHGFIKPWFVEISLKICISQTVRARKLKFLDIVHYCLCVMCHASHITYHMSYVIKHKKLQKNIVDLFGGGSVINGAYPNRVGPVNNSSFPVVHHLFFLPMFRSKVSR